MNIPKLPGSKRLFLPVLEAMSRGEDLHASQLVEPIRQHFSLSEEEVSSTRAGSSKPLIYEKLTGTIMHLVKAGLLDRTRRGYTRISLLGLKLLSTKPEQVNYTTLREFCDYNPNKSKGKPARRGTKGAPAPMPAVATEAAVDRAVSQLNNALVVALANEVRQASATDLSHIVCELLERLGYGSVQTDPRANGSSGGTVLTDPLGLNHAYVKTAAGEKPDLRDLQIFASAIETTQTDVGVFVSAKGFTNQATGYAMGSPKQMVLLDSEELARLMVAHNIGVQEHDSHIVKRLDQSYFPVHEEAVA